MKIAVWSVTKKGGESSKIIGDALDAEVFTLEKFAISGSTPVENFSESLSEKLNSRMRSLEEAKEIDSLILDNKEVNLYLPTNVKVANLKNSPEGIIVYSNKKNIKITQLYPKNIVIGIGCRYGKSFGDIYKGLHEALDICNISSKSIKHIATVDIKKDEKGIIELSELLKVPLKIVDSTEIFQYEETFKKSEFVKESVGVSSVSAPTAYITSCKKGKFLLEKHIYDGVTVSIYEESE